MKKIGGVTFDGKNTDNWVGTSGSNGTCVVSYDKDKGVIFTWSGGSIKEFTYVNKDKVYRTTDGGKTWYDITP